MKNAVPLALAVLWALAGAAGADAPITSTPKVAELESVLAAASREEDWSTTPALRTQIAGIPEVWRLNEYVLAGTAAPDDAALAALAAEGVHTIICLDAQPPDTKAAAAHGMLAMHVPARHGRLDVAEHLMLLRVLAYLQDDFYIHAGPGERRALVSAAMAVQWMERRWAGVRALRLMTDVGIERERTSDWASAFSPIRRAGVALVKEKMPLNLEPAVPADPLSVEMQRIDAAFARLADFAANGWKTLPHLDDATPADEARTIAETLSRRAGIGIAAEQPLAERMRQAAAAAQDLADAAARKDSAAATERFRTLGNACMECHRETRDR